MTKKQPPKSLRYIRTINAADLSFNDRSDCPLCNSPTLEAPEHPPEKGMHWVCTKCGCYVNRHGECFMDEFHNRKETEPK